LSNEYCVYKHTNKINNKVYIGMTKNIKERWRNNGIAYKPYNYNTRPFWNAINKYGWDNFTHEILIDGLTFEDACKKEIYFISRFHSRERDKGYNVAIGGNGGHIYKIHPRGMLGKHQTEHQKENQHEFMQNPENWPMHKITWGIDYPHPKGMLGKKQTLHQKEVAHSLRGKNSSHGRNVEIILNGKIKKYKTVTLMINDWGFGSKWVYRRLKSNKPYKFNSKSCQNNRDFFKKLDGCIIKYCNNKEDTEVS